MHIPFSQDLRDGAEIGHSGKVSPPMLRGSHLVRCKELHPGAKEPSRQRDFPSVLPPGRNEGDVVLLHKVDKVKRGQCVTENSLLVQSKITCTDCIEYS